MRERPLVIAHRGASGYLPENSLPAIRKAIEMGADIVEIDVHMTKDNQIAVLHDAYVMDGLRRRIVRRCCYGEMCEVLERRNRERTPLLREVLEVCAAAKVGLVIEIKPGGLEEVIARELSASGSARWCSVMSFRSEVVTKLRNLLPAFSLGFIDSPRRNVRPEELFRKVFKCGANFAAIDQQKLTKGLVESFRTIGCNLWSWTVNEQDRMRELAEWGVDGLITNFPDRLIEMKKEMRKGK